MARRTRVREDSLNQVLLDSKRRCCICFAEGVNKPKKGSVVHLFPYDTPRAGTPDNLVFLCPNHHAALDKGRLSPSDVKAARDRLYTSLRQQDDTRSVVTSQYERYERKVRDILRTEISRSLGDYFSLDANRVLESRSGLHREVDLAITITVLGSPILILVEIKYGTRGLVISDIEAIASKFQDLGAAKGLVVCNSGFTVDAIKRAQSLSIGLLQIDADSEDSEQSASDKVTYVG